MSNVKGAEFTRIAQRRNVERLLADKRDRKAPLTEDQWQYLAECTMRHLCAATNPILLHKKCPEKTNSLGAKKSFGK